MQKYLSLISILLAAFIGYSQVDNKPGVESLSSGPAPQPLWTFETRG